MNILFLIGNGFDINLEMKTRYTDFYNHYKSIISKSNLINKVKNEISYNYKNWSDLEYALGQYTKNFNSTEEFDEVFEDILNQLSIYLQDIEKNFDYSKVNKKKLMDDLINPEHSLLPADRKKITTFKNLWKSSRFNVNVITFNYTKSLETLLGGKQTNIQIGNHSNTSNIVLSRIEHIHGYVDKRMVMGVNDLSQLSNKSFHNNPDVIEAIVKSNCNQAYRHTIDDSCKDQISKANLICIFGSSLGVTDNMWWKLIGSQLRNQCNIIIFTRCDNIPENQGYKKNREVRRIKEHFLNKTAFSKLDKESLSEKIFVGVNTEMFNLI